MRTERLALLLVAGVFALTLVALAVSGAWLAGHYSPGLDPTARSVHRVAALLALPTGVAVPVVAMARRRPRTAAVALVFLLAVPAALYTGVMLPWSTLALRLVRVGAGHHGVLAAFGDDVRKVWVRETVLGLWPYRLLVVEHLVVLPAVLLVAGRFLLRR